MVVVVVVAHVNQGSIARSFPLISLLSLIHLPFLYVLRKRSVAGEGAVNDSQLWGRIASGCIEG